LNYRKYFFLLFFKNGLRFFVTRHQFLSLQKKNNPLCSSKSENTPDSAKEHHGLTKKKPFFFFQK